MREKMEDLEELLATQDTRGIQQITGGSTVQDTILRLVSIVVDLEKRLEKVERNQS